MMNNEITEKINFGIALTSCRSGLKYGTDAILLAAFMDKKPNDRSLEIGSGTGVVSLIAAKAGKAGHITALEVQEYYASLTERNIAANDLGDRITSVLCDVREYKTDRKFDSVFTNPPYMRADNGKRNEDGGKFAARHENNGTIYELCASAAELLRYGGTFYCVYRPDRIADLTDAMRKSRIEPKKICFVHSDSLHAPCLMLVKGRKDGGVGCEVMRPLFLYRDGTAELTGAAEKIYSAGEWYE